MSRSEALSSGVGGAVFAACVILLGSTLFAFAAEEEPLAAARVAELNRRFEAEIASCSAGLKQTPNSVDLYSRRGDAFFFQGKFVEAVADYEKMVALDPDKERDHWRKGIAYFYARRFTDAAHQFEVYHNFDDVDRENGIWRFLSQAKAYGIDKAREGLLKYKKDDREPFPALYELFAGKLTGDEILNRIHAAKIGVEEREKRLFYAELYIGLNDAVAQKPEQALRHLRQAVANPWGPKAGFGPSYMWHVGRVQYDVLKKELASQ